MALLLGSLDGDGPAVDAVHGRWVIKPGRDGVSFTLDTLPYAGASATATPITNAWNLTD